MAIESLTNGVVEDNFNKIGDVEVLLRMLYLFIYFSSVNKFIKNDAMKNIYVVDCVVLLFNCLAKSDMHVLGCPYII